MRSIFAGTAMLVGIVACGPPPGPTTDADALPDADGPTDSASDDSAVPTDAGTDDWCHAYAMGLCAHMALCMPRGLDQLYLDLATCVEATTNGCARFALPGTHRVDDPARCFTDLSASCVDFAPVRACLWLPGEITAGETCLGDSQCAMGVDASGAATRLHCRGASGDGCIAGTCEASDPADGTRGECIGSNEEDECDVGAGFRCRRELDPASPDHLDPRGPTCLRVTFGEAGAACAAGSDHECAFGFRCVANVCRHELAEGDACDPSEDLCGPDHLVCASEAPHVCTRFAGVARNGEPCSTNLDCNGGALCDADPADTCASLFECVGGVCVDAPLCE